MLRRLSVGLGAAGDGVIAGVAEQHVGAGQAADEIIAGAALQRHTAARAG